MGIAIVLIFWAIDLAALALIAAAVLGTFTHWLTKRSVAKHKRAVVASIAFPFVSVAFAGIWFVFYAVTNTMLFHRDPGLGDSWETPLPNGYALLMIDVNDQGTVYNPKTKSGYGSVSAGDDAIFGVRQLQVSGPHIYGASDSAYFEHRGQESNEVDSYFELNTSTRTHQKFPSLNSLDQQADAEGVHLKLRPFAQVFDDYRTTWFDYTCIVVLFLVPCVAFIFLARWIWNIRKQISEIHTPQ